MHTLSLKKRTAEVISRASYALILGGFVDKRQIYESDLTDEAKATLYFHAIANCLFSLHVLYLTSVSGDKNWATLEFFLENVIDGFSRYEKEHSLSPGTITQEAISIFAKVGGYASTKGVYPDTMSALEVEKADPEASVDEVREIIQKSSKDFHSAIAKMFTFDEVNSSSFERSSKRIEPTLGSVDNLSDRYYFESEKHRDENEDVTYRRESSDQWRVTTLALHFTALTAVGTLLNIFGLPTIESRAAVIFVGQGLGTAAGACLIGLAGCLYKSNRTLGFIVAAWLYLIVSSFL